MTTSDRVLLWLAEGLGSGRLRPGPGTWGSVVALLWLILLLSCANLWIWAVGTLLGLVAAVPICARAERLLGTEDPGSVVLDEITALPLVWIGVLWTPGGAAFSQPVAPTAIAWAHAPELLTGWVAFRVFDIWKPGPIRTVQRFPNGLGVVADDVLAALAAAAVVAGVAYARWGTG